MKTSATKLLTPPRRQNSQMDGGRTLCLISEATGPYNAIGRIAMAQAEAALAAGWKVSVVANRLDESLQPRVEWLKLYVPPRGFVLQWLSGRYFIKRAIGKRKFDLVHGHQPQIADLCDIFQCHFLTRAAYEAGCLEDHHGLRWVIELLQKRTVLMAEDYFYRRWNPKTQMLFNSALTRQAFARFYGLPKKEALFLCPSPKVDLVSPAERQAARQKFIGHDPGKPVIGFLGGLHERKGYRQVIQSLAGETGVFFLMGGQFSEGYQPPGLDGHSKSVGLVDTHEFYAACDVLVVASHFEPFGLVALEAAARGIPVIATPEVGALPHLLEYRAGLEWKPSAERLRPLIDQIIRNQDAFRAASLAWAESLSENNHQQQLSELYLKCAAPAGRTSCPSA